MLVLTTVRVKLFDNHNVRE